MIDYSNAFISELHIHYAGKKSIDEGVTLSTRAVEMDDPDLHKILKTYFLSSFTGENQYYFGHPQGLNFNEVYSFSKDFFEGKTDLQTLSHKITQHLYDSSEHPMIKPGEVYIAEFKEIKSGNQILPGIGIFKTERKDTYLKVNQKEKDFKVDFQEGINIKKLDKGCLILNTGAEEGFEVHIIDNTNKGNEARYWTEDFLQAVPKNNDFLKTNNYLDLVKNFSKEKIPSSDEKGKAAQIDLLNRSMDFFKKKEKFDEREFETEIIEEPELVKNFQDYKRNYSEEKEVVFEESFDINPVAVKKSKTRTGNIIQLDNNFKIQVMGNKDYIVRGKDPETGLNYYVLYFEEEK